MPICSYDVETTGLSPYKGAEIFAFCIGYENGKVAVYRLDKGNRESALKILQGFFDNTSIEKVAHNTKFDLKHTRHLGIKIPKETVWHDTMIMSQLLRNLAPSHALDYLCWELAGYPRDLDVEVHKRGKEYNGYQNVPEYLMREYQRADGERTMLLYQLWFEKYIKNDARVYKDYLNEIELIKTIDRMEDVGINLSQPHVDKLKSWMEDELEQVQFRTLKEFGEAINLNSDDQVANLLYRRLKLPILEYTENGKPATGKDVLLKLRDNHSQHLETYNLIFKQRSYTKGLAILRGYEEHSDERKIIHPNIKSNEAVTGRLACSEPNLMNVSKEKVLKNPFPVPSRRAFRARIGYLMYFVDYAGIELRLGIEVAKSSKMIMLMKQGIHPHVEAAKLFFREKFKSKKENKDLYDASKNAHFALMYGAGLAQFATTLNLSIAEAKIGYQNYENAFPEIAHLSTNISKKVLADGFIDTPFGRRLTVSKSKAYSGLNYLIQGTAAGILKRALVRVDKYLSENWNDEIRLVLPIHDEIVLSYPRTLIKYSEKVLVEISRIMIDMKEINVPLDVEWKMTTTTWDQAKDVSVDYRRLNE